MTTKLDETIALALQLSPWEQLQLIQEVASHLNLQFEPSEHWGQNLVRLLNSLDLSEWDQEDIDNPVAWVKHQRESGSRQFDWGNENE
jgi:hypothetical protein